MPSYLVTGASRGLGLGFVTELLKDPSNIVVATARDTAGSSGLHELKANHRDDRLLLIDLDVSKQDSIRAAAEQTARLLPGGLDHLISNAGVAMTGVTADLEALSTEIIVTVMAPILLMKEFLPLIRDGDCKRILVVSSVLGSIHNAPFTPNLMNGYSIAKAALNMLARKWSPLLKTEGITIAIIHPGWIPATEIGDEISAWVAKYAPDLERFTIEESAAGCVKVLNGLTIDNSGEFFSHDGAIVPF
ncbi:putative short-chain dehydrogenase [Dactylonectria macrodidyma]|uniref:Short-chain dehydrogenase n=1 Tax=Dactylonectria macrodidyma TaxID=307937 RepID=A0A9P9DLV8_9HYPO|nr:putative short-chain dehydrogenase [Dactylonectria macrodidyma]